jgi:glycogen operon protein
VNPGTWSAADERASVWPGRSWPLGSSWTEECTNFAVHAPRADGMWLCLFDEHDEETRERLT